MVQSNVRAVPTDINAAKQAADAERTKIRAEGFAEGKKAAEHAQGPRTVAIAALCSLAALAVGALGAVSLYEKGIFTGGAVTDQTLRRTVPQPVAPFSITYPEDQSSAYDRNSAKAREGVIDPRTGQPARAPQ